jgi:hypothetical protein
MASLYRKLLRAMPSSPSFTPDSPFSFGRTAVETVPQSEVAVVLDLPLTLGGAAAALDLAKRGLLPGLPEGEAPFWTDGDRPLAFADSHPAIRAYRDKLARDRAQRKSRPVDHSLSFARERDLADAGDLFRTYSQTDENNPVGIRVSGAGLHIFADELNYFETFGWAANLRLHARTASLHQRPPPVSDGESLLPMFVFFFSGF